VCADASGRVRRIGPAGAQKQSGAEEVSRDQPGAESSYKGHPRTKGLDLEQKGPVRADTPGNKGPVKGDTPGNKGPVKGDTPGN
jgi:hypothetical protein